MAEERMTKAAAMPTTGRMTDVRYVYRWNRQDRKGQECAVLARGTMNSCCVQFDDGYTMVTSRNALKRARPDPLPETKGIAAA